MSVETPRSPRFFFEYPIRLINNYFSTNRQGMIPEYETPDARSVNNYFSTNRQGMIPEYETPDARSVRIESDSPLALNGVWTASEHEPTGLL